MQALALVGALDTHPLDYLEQVDALRGPPPAPITHAAISGVPRGEVDSHAVGYEGESPSGKVGEGIRSDHLARAHDLGGGHALGRCDCAGVLVGELPSLPEIGKGMEPGPREAEDR